jgi:ribosomal protein S18 acetylase RimI-like enzyme
MGRSERRANGGFMSAGKGRRTNARQTAMDAVVQAEMGEVVPPQADRTPSLVEAAKAAPNLALLPARKKRAAPKARAPAERQPGPLVVVEADGTVGDDAEAQAARKNHVEVRVRRLHRRDLNRTWEFLKLVFRTVNRETVEYQRPRSKARFTDVYEEEGEQLLFEVGDQVVGYAECAFNATGADNWINPRYFDKRGMRPLYVEELAVHPDYQGKGVGGFMLDQLQHLARVRGCTHLVLEVAENNESALSWYRRRNFFKLDAAIFLAQKVPAEPELLPPRKLPVRAKPGGKAVKSKRPGGAARKTPTTRATKRK